ncbi:MAG: hypothetical protein ACXVAN_13030, partial [Polyangia bacterium]
LREPSTATINERPRRPAPPPAAVPLHPRSTVSGVARALLAVAALVAALLVPLPNAPAARWPLVAVDLPAAAPPSQIVADETPSPSTREPEPERAAVATAAPSERPVRHASTRARHHSRHDRLGQTVAIGRIVDPFRAR